MTVRELIDRLKDLPPDYVVRNRAENEDIIGGVVDVPAWGEVLLVAEGV